MPSINSKSTKVICLTEHEAERSRNELIHIGRTVSPVKRICASDIEFANSFDWLISIGDVVHHVSRWLETGNRKEECPFFMIEYY